MPSNPLRVATETSARIRRGDLLWLETLLVSEVARPFGTSERFPHTFLGVSLSYNLSGECPTTLVATGGDHWFDCEPDTFHLGEWVHAVGPQKVAKCHHPEHAIGQVCEARDTPRNTVKVRIKSRVFA